MLGDKDKGEETDTAGLLAGATSSSLYTYTSDAKGGQGENGWEDESDEGGGGGGGGYDDDDNEADGLHSPHNRYTLDQAVERMGFGRFHWQLLFLCGVGYFAEITELVIVSFVAPAIQNDMGLSSLEYGMLGSSSFVGMTAGAMFWGYISDRFGRQVSFSLTVWLTFIGGLLSAFSPNYAILLLLRFTAAFGIGGMLPVDYTIFLEFLPTKNRGSHIVLVDAIGVVPALFLSALVAYAFSGKEDIQWRWVLGIVSVPVGVMAVLRRHVPESPRFHLANHEVQKAQEILEKVAEMNQISLPPGKLAPIKKRANRSPQQPSASSPLSSLSGGRRGQEDSNHNADDSKGGGGSFFHKTAQLFEGATLKQTTPRLWLLWFLTQFSSAGMVFALPKVFDQTFDVSKKRIALDLLWGVFGLIPGLAIAYFAVEKSRKYSLAGFYLAAGVSVFFFMLTTVGFMKNEAMAIVASVLLRGSLEGCFAILNTTSVESYPTPIRASGLGTAQIFDHIAGAASPLFFSLFNENTKLRPIALTVYAAAYALAFFPAVTLPKDYVGQAIKD